MPKVYTDPSELPPCDPEVFRKGTPLLAVSTHECRAIGFEPWVELIRKESGQRVDWHYSGGIANVLYIGDRVKILEVMVKHPCPGRILRQFNEGDAGLYRDGVTEVPEGTVGGFYEPGASQSTYMVEQPE